MLGPRAVDRIVGAVPRQPAGALRGADHDVVGQVTVDVRHDQPDVLGPALGKGVLGPARRRELLDPGAVLRHVEVVVAVDVPERDALSGPRREGDLRPTRACLAPEIGAVAVLLARDDVEIEIAVDVGQLDVMVVGAAGADQVLGPWIGPWIAARPGVLVPLETGCRSGSRRRGRRPHPRRRPACRSSRSPRRGSCASPSSDTRTRTCRRLTSWRRSRRAGRHRPRPPGSCSGGLSGCRRR